MAGIDDKITRLLELAKLHGADANGVETYHAELLTLSAKKLDAELAKAERAELERQAAAEARRIENAEKLARSKGLEKARVKQRIIHAGKVYEPGANVWLPPDVILGRPDHVEPI